MLVDMLSIALVRFCVRRRRESGLGGMVILMRCMLGWM